MIILVLFKTSLGVMNDYIMIKNETIRKFFQLLIFGGGGGFKLVSCTVEQKLHH
jgi:hypothetical protein